MTVYDEDPCPYCGHIMNAPAADQPDPDAPDRHEAFAMDAEGYSPPVGVPVGDDTTVTTGQWTADPSSTSRISRGMDEAYVYAASAEDRESLRGEFLVALNRVGATPDLTALHAGALARMFHENYERLAPLYGYRTRDESAVPWEKVPIRNRELMYATASAVLAAVAALVRSAQNDTDDG